MDLNNSPSALLLPFTYQASRELATWMAERHLDQFIGKGLPAFWKHRTPRNTPSSGASCPVPFSPTKTLMPGENSRSNSLKAVKFSSFTLVRPMIVRPVLPEQQTVNLKQAPLYQVAAKRPNTRGRRQHKRQFAWLSPLGARPLGQRSPQPSRLLRNTQCSQALQSGRKRYPVYALIMSMISPTSLRTWSRDVRDFLPLTMQSWKWRSSLTKALSQSMYGSVR